VQDYNPAVYRFEVRVLNLADEDDFKNEDWEHHDELRSPGELSIKQLVA